MSDEPSISQQAQGSYIAQAAHGGSATVNVVLPSVSLTEKQRKQNRMRMIDRVEMIWIKGVLEPSVQAATLVALELENKPSAVTPSWHVLKEFDKTGPLSSADASIVQVYDRAGGEVLILGEPGAGKTTLLLELTRALLERARQDEAHPIPVVFSLSSWAAKRQVLTEWLASELSDKYQVPPQTATSWIKSDQVLPLLDGLDEVAVPYQAACVEAINDYRHKHGLVLPTVVCSRQTEYLGLSSRLLLRTAVIVQPLSIEQIESYMASAGAKLEALHQGLHEDADLRTLASTPLMLTLLTAAYQGKQPEIFSPSDSLPGKQYHIFTSYVQRMLIRRSVQSPYSQAHIQHWLTWLARQMQKRNITEFSPGLLQPTWLPTKGSHLFYTLLNVFFLGLFGGVFGILLGLNFASLLGISKLELGLIGGLFLGVSSGLSALQQTRSEIRPVLPWRYLSRYADIPRFVESSDLTWKKAFPRILTTGLVCGLMIGGLDGLVNGPIYGLFAGLFTGLLIGVLLILLLPFIRWRQSVNVRKLNKELTTRRGEKKNFPKPNLFILLSGRYALFRGLAIGIFLAFFFGLVGEVDRQANSPVLGLTYGLFCGLYFGLMTGRAFLRHYALRFLLWRNGSMPWHYVRFLDFAAERILLRKVGGSYIFLHRLLLDYFANLEAKTPSSGSVERSQQRLQPDTMPSTSLEPDGADEHSDVLIATFAPTPGLSEAPHLLPCGHELRAPGARFCSVCGASITTPNTLT